MIRLNVFIRTTESNRDELVTIARELTAASLRDEGCVAYDLYESATRRDVLLICETWQDEASLAAHARQPHYTVLVPRLRELGEMKTEKFVF
ncbi:putative quinol monooxygenase [Alistipes sp.]|uniref:putative quinol monooxygenase n=1 Tax=Alistipes sp. TaxID=1872444 RepID=UPI003AB518E7